MRKRARSDDAPGVMMEPMIDCVFLLLIFFLVAATIRKKHNELPIELPPAGNAKVKKADDETVVISLVHQKDGVLYAYSTVGEQMRSTGGAREMVSKQELLNKISAAASQNRERKVRIDADHRVPYGLVTEVIDMLERHRLNRIGLRTLGTTHG